MFVFQKLTPRYLLLILILIFLLPAGCIEHEITARNSKQIENVCSDVSALRGLSRGDQIEFEILTNEEHERMCRESASASSGENRCEYDDIEQEVWEMLDLVEEEQNLSEMRLESEIQSIIGFYRFRDHKCFIVTDVKEIGARERLTAAHEYAHALQDQYFDLLTLNEDVWWADEMLALDALIEGDAMLTEHCYEAAGTDSFSWINEDTEELEEPSEKPQFLGENDYFPYEEGLDFVKELWKFGGWDAVNDAYSNPPKSSEQILHPEKYFLYADEPWLQQLPDFTEHLEGNWELKYEEVLGEFDLGLYLQMFLPASIAAEAAAGWSGDLLEYWKNENGHKLLALKTEWDSNKDALEFRDAYIKFIEEKSQSEWELLQDNEDIKWWQANDGLNVHLEKFGWTLNIVLAYDQDVVAQVWPIM